MPGGVCKTVLDAQWASNTLLGEPRVSMDAQAERYFPIFISVWVVLGIFSALFFFSSTNAALKRKVHPPFVIGVGALFLSFVVLMGFARDAFFFFVMAPAVALITFLNLRNTKFCDSCGKTLIGQNPFIRPASLAGAARRQTRGNW